MGSANCDKINRICTVKGPYQIPQYTVQDFLIKLGIKPGTHPLKISILSLYNVIIRSTKIMNRGEKNLAHFFKTKYFKNQNVQKNSLIKVDILVKYYSQKTNQKDSVDF